MVSAVASPAPTGALASSLAAHVTGGSWGAGATALRQAWYRARPGDPPDTARRELPRVLPQAAEPRAADRARNRPTRPLEKARSSKPIRAHHRTDHDLMALGHDEVGSLSSEKSRCSIH